MQIPYAVDSENRLVSDRHGLPGALYKCPACSEKVVYKCGDIREHHFSHYPNVSCSKEAVIQRIGQRLLVDRVNDCLKKPAADRSFPSMTWGCIGSCHGIRKFTLPAGAVRAVTDYALPSGKTVHIMLLDGADSPLLAVSIKGVRHAGHTTHGEASGIPWIIIDGTDVLAVGTSWVIRSSYQLEDCPDCTAIERRNREEYERQRIRAEENRKRWAEQDAAQAAAQLDWRHGKVRPKSDILGEFTVQGFTWLMKLCPCIGGHQTPAWTWPDGKPYGEVTVDRERIPTNLIPVEGTSLFSARCQRCGTVFYVGQQNTAAGPTA